MGKSKKPEKKPSEMTTQELAERLFPKKLKSELDKIAHKGEEKPDKHRSNSSQRKA